MSGEKKKQSKSKKDQEEIDPTDYCGICEEGGELLICDGSCSKAFHLSCVGLSEVPKSDKWFCSSCAPSHQETPSKGLKKRKKVVETDPLEDVRVL